MSKWIETHDLLINVEDVASIEVQRPDGCFSNYYSVSIHYKSGGKSFITLYQNPGDAYNLAAKLCYEVDPEGWRNRKILNPMDKPRHESKNDNE